MRKPAIESQRVKDLITYAVQVHLALVRQNSLEDFLGKKKTAQPTKPGKKAPDVC